MKNLTLLERAKNNNPQAIEELLGDYRHYIRLLGANANRQVTPIQGGRVRLSAGDLPGGIPEDCGLSRLFRTRISWLVENDHG